MKLHNMQIHPPIHNIQNNVNICRFIDPEEDEIFVGPMTTNEKSRTCEDSLEDSLNSGECIGKCEATSSSNRKSINDTISGHGLVDDDIYADMSLMKLEEASYDGKDVLNDFFCDISLLSKSQSIYEDSLECIGNVASDLQEEPGHEGCTREFEDQDSGCHVNSSSSEEVLQVSIQATVQSESPLSCEPNCLGMEDKIAMTDQFEDSLRDFEVSEEGSKMSEACDRSACTVEDGLNDKIDNIDCGGKYYDELAAMLELQAKYAADAESLHKEEKASETRRDGSTSCELHSGVGEKVSSQDNLGETKLKRSPLERASKIPLMEKPSVVPAKRKVIKHQAKKIVTCGLTRSNTGVLNKFQSPVAKVCVFYFVLHFNGTAG